MPAYHLHLSQQVLDYINGQSNGDQSNQRLGDLGLFDFNQENSPALMNFQRSFTHFINYVTERIQPNDTIYVDVAPTAGGDAAWTRGAINAAIQNQRKNQVKLVMNSAVPQESTQQSFQNRFNNYITDTVPIDAVSVNVDMDRLRQYEHSRTSQKQQQAQHQAMESNNRPAVAFVGSRNDNQTTVSEQSYTNNYWWRESNVSPNSPVSLNEFIRAVSSSLPSKKRVSALKATLTDNMTRNGVVNHPDSEDGKRTFTRILSGTDQNGLRYNMSPDQVETTVAILSAARDAGLDYDLTANNQGVIEMKINDNAGSKVRILDLQEPYRVGEVNTRDGVDGRMLLGHVLFDSPENQTNPRNSLVSTYDSNGQLLANGTFYNRKTQAYQFADNSYDYRRIHSARSYGNRTAIDEQASSEKTLANYVGLDQNIKNRLALSPMIALLGLDSEMLHQNGLRNADGQAINPQTYSIARGRSDAFRADLDLGQMSGNIKSVAITSADEQPRVYPGVDNQQFNLSSAVQLSSSQFVASKSLANPNQYTTKQAMTALKQNYQEARIAYLNMLEGPDQGEENPEYQKEQKQYKKLVMSALGDPDSSDYPDTELVKNTLNAINNGVRKASVATDGHQIDDQSLMQARYDLLDNYDGDSNKQQLVSMLFDGTVNQMNHYVGHYFSNYNYDLAKKDFEHVKQQADQYQDFISQVDVKELDDYIRSLDNSDKLADRNQTLTEAIDAQSNGPSNAQQTRQQYLNGRIAEEKENQDNIKTTLYDALTKNNPDLSETEFEQRLNQAVKIRPNWKGLQKELVSRNPDTFNINALNELAGQGSPRHGFELANYIRQAGVENAVRANNDYAMDQIMERTVKFNPKTAQTQADLQAALKDPNGRDQKLQAYLKDVRARELKGETIDIAKEPAPFNKYIVHRPTPVVQKDADGHKVVKTMMRIGLINPVSPTQAKLELLQTAQQQLKDHHIDVAPENLSIDDHGLIHFDGYRQKFTAVAHAKSQKKSLVAYHGDQIARSEPDDEHSQTGDRSVYTVSSIAGQDKLDARDIQQLRDAGGSEEDVQKLVDAQNRRKARGVQEHLGKEPVSATIGQFFVPDYDGIIYTNYNTYEGHADNHNFAFQAYNRRWYRDLEKNPDGSFNVEAIDRELKNGLGINNRLVEATPMMVIQRELRQAMDNVLNTNDVGDISQTNSATIANKLLHSEILGQRVPEGILNEAPSDVRNARIATNRDRCKLYATADQATNTTHEINYIHDLRQYMKDYAATHQGKLPSRAQAIAALHEPIALYGGTSVGIIAQKQNWGYISPNATGQGASQGTTVFRTPGSTNDGHGNVRPTVAYYYDEKEQKAKPIMETVKDANGQPVMVDYRDEQGQVKQRPLRMPQRVRELSVIEYNPTLNTLSNSTWDRIFIAVEQSLKAEWTDAHAKVATLNPNMLTMEDSCVISKDFANKHLVSSTPKQYDADGNEVKRPVMVGDKLSDGSGNKTTVGHVIDPDMSVEEAQQAGLLDVLSLFKQNPQLEMVISGLSPMSRINMSDAKSFLDQTNHQQNGMLKFNAYKLDENGNLIPKQDENGNPIYATDEHGQRKLVRTKWAMSGQSDQELLDLETNAQHMPLFEKNADGTPKYALEYETNDTPVDTNASLNELFIIGTDQLVDQKVSTYEAGESASLGRKYSQLVANADSQRGAFNVANYMHRTLGTTDDSFRKFRALLLTTGVDINGQGQLSRFNPSDLSKLGPAIANNIQNYRLPAEYQEIAMRGGMIISNRGRTREPLIENGQVTAKAADKRGLPQLQYTGATQAQNGQIYLTNDSQQLINTVITELFKPGYSGIANSDDLTRKAQYNAGSDFLTQLPDNGILQLPAGVKVHLRGLGVSKNQQGRNQLNLTDKLYILPNSMRKMTTMLDGTSRVDEYTHFYKTLGTKLAKYQTVRTYLQQHGVPRTNDPREQALVDRQLTKTLDIQGTVDALQNSVINNELGGVQTRYTWLRDHILGRTMPHSATSQMSNNANLPIDAIEVSPQIAKQLGLVADPNDPNGFAHYKDHPEWQYVHFHRDPVWQAPGSLALRVIINPQIKDVRTNPMMVSLCDGDYDGDNVGLIGMADELAQKDLAKMTPSHTLLSQAKNNTLNPDTGMNISAEFVDQATKTNLALTYDNVSGQLNDPRFRGQALLAISHDFPGMKLDPLLEFKDHNEHVIQGKMSDQDFQKAMIDNQIKIDALNIAKDDPLATNNKKFLGKFASAQIAKFYNEQQPEQAGQWFDHLIQQVRTSAGNRPENNVMNQSGVNYNSTAEFFQCMEQYLKSGAKGKDSYRQQMIQYLSLPTMQEQLKALNYAQGAHDAKGAESRYQEYLNGNANQISDGQHGLFAMLTDDKNAKDTYQGVEQINNLAIQVQNATKIKSAMTGVPGRLQQTLVAALKRLNEQGLYVANTVGYTGTQSNLQVKHDPDKARVQSEVFQLVLGNLMNGQIDTTKPTYAFEGPTGTTTALLDSDDQGSKEFSAEDRQKAGAMLLGADPLEVAERLSVIDRHFSTARTLDGRLEKQSWRQVETKVMDQMSDDEIKQFASNELHLSNTDKWSKQDTLAMRNTIVHSQKAYEAEAMADDLASNNKNLSSEGFKAAMKHAYQTQLGLGLDDQVVDFLAKAFTNPKTNEMSSIKQDITSKGNASLLDKVNMNGYNAILDALPDNNTTNSEESLFKGSPMISKMLNFDQSTDKLLDLSTDGSTSDLLAQADQENSLTGIEVNDAGAEADNSDEHSVDWDSVIDSINHDVSQNITSQDAKKAEDELSKYNDEPDDASDKEESAERADEKRQKKQLQRRQANAYSEQEILTRLSVADSQHPFTAFDSRSNLHNKISSMQNKRQYQSIYQYVIVQECQMLGDTKNQHAALQAQSVKDLVRIAKSADVAHNITKEARDTIVRDAIGYKVNNDPKLAQSLVNTSASDLGLKQNTLGQAVDDVHRSLQQVAEKQQKKQQQRTQAQQKSVDQNKSIDNELDLD